MTERRWRPYRPDFIDVGGWFRTTRGDFPNAVLKAVLGPCLGVSIYDPRSRAGGLSHALERIRTIHCVQEMLFELADLGASIGWASRRNLEVGLASMSSKRGRFIAVKNFLIDFGFVDIRETTALEGQDCVHMGFDTANNGEIFEVETKIHFPIDIR